MNIQRKNRFAGFLCSAALSTATLFAQGNYLQRFVRYLAVPFAMVLMLGLV